MFCAIVLMTLLGIARTVHAQSLYQVTLNTSALNGLGTYYVEFSIVDGSTPGNGNASVTIQNFQVNGGTLNSVLPPTIGNVSGQLGPSSSLVLKNTDSGGLVDFTQGFAVTSSTSSLVFTLGLTNSGTDTPQPDNFSMQILDSSENAIATTGPTGIEIVDAVFTDSSPIPSVYASTGFYSPPITGTASVALVPESGSVALLALGGVFFFRIPQRIRGNLTLS